MFRKERRPSAHPHNNPQSQDGASCEESAEPTTKKRFSLIRAFSKLSRSSSFQNLPKFSMGVGGGEQDQDKTNNSTPPGIFSKFFKRDNGGEEGSASASAAAASSKRKSLWQRSKSILKAATTATFSKSTSLSKSGADLEDGESVCSGPMNKYRLIGSGLMTRIEFNTTSVNETTLDTDGVLLKLLESNREAYEMLKERKRLEAAAGKETNDQLIIEESPAVNNSGVLNDDYAAVYQEIDGEQFFFQDNIQLDSPLLSTDNESSSCIVSESELEPLISYESSVYTSEEEDNNVEEAVGHTLEEMTQMFDILGIGEPERFPDGSLRYVLEPEVTEDCEDNDHDNENGNDEGGEGVKDKVVEIIEFKQWKDEVTESETEVKEAAEPLKMTVGRNAKSADTFTSIQLNEIAPNPNSNLMKKTRSFSHSVTATAAAATTKRPSTNANGENNLNLDRRHSMGEQVAKIVAMFEGI